MQSTSVLVAKLGAIPWSLASEGGKAICRHRHAASTDSTIMLRCGPDPEPICDSHMLIQALNGRKGERLRN